MDPERLAYDPADSIAFDRVSGNPDRDSQTDPRAQRIRGRRQTEIGVAEAAALAVGRIEFGLAAQAAQRGECQPCRHRAVTDQMR